MNNQDKENTSEHTSPLGPDFAAYVQKNHDYYLKQFNKFKEGGKDRFRFTWNWAAFLLPCIWPAYRRMYGWAIIALLLFVVLLWVELVNVPPILLAGLPGLIFGMTGNYLYYLKIRKAMRWRIGSTSKCGITIAAPIVLLWTIIVLFVGLNVPAYFRYETRSYDAAALSDLRNAKTMMDAIYSDHQSYTSTKLSSPSSVTSLVDSADHADPTSSYPSASLSRGVELKLLAVDQDGYLISSQHEKGRHLYLSGQNANNRENGIVSGVKLQLTGKVNIAQIAQTDTEKMPENDGKAYKVLQDVRRAVSQIALKERNAKIDGSIFKGLARDKAVRIGLPYHDICCSRGTTRGA